LENNDYAAQKTWPNNEPRTLNDDGDPAEVSNIWYRGVSGESGGVKCSQWVSRRRIWLWLCYSCYCCTIIVVA